MSETWDIHHNDSALGDRFIADEPTICRHSAGKKRGKRLRSEHQIWSVLSKKRDLYRKTDLPVHDHLVNREFETFDRVRLAHITEHPTGECKVCSCAI